MHRILLMAAALGLLAGCGGTGSSRNLQNTPPPPNLGGGSVGAPTAVGVSAGQAVGGINITVVSPATAAAPPNAQVLGVANLTGSGEAFNTGGTISRGATRRVLLFGPGLSGAMTVTITGPSDVTPTAIQTIKATDGTPGVAFTANATSNAALGCRTVVLQATNGDITTFTGGLEVVP